MSSERLLRLDSVCRDYQTYASPQDKLKELLGLKPASPPKHAVVDVSFALQQGEILGLVGHNGAGKSTLLQMIAGTLRPTSGSVERRGRITALLELGAGVDPELTGRENVFLMGGAYGLTAAEVAERFDEIIAFSELEEDIDRPMKGYSSGMFVRLAFAVSTALEPDILIVDEALSVGDIGFQARCLDRLEQLIDNGASIVLASHDLQLIKNYCTRALCLEHGRIVAEGSPEEVVEHYYYLMRRKSGGASAGLSWHSQDGQVQLRSREASIISVDVERGGTAPIRSGDKVLVKIAAHLSDTREARSFAIVLMLRDVRGYNLHGLVARDSQGELRWTGPNQVEAWFSLPLRVAEGEYSLTARIEDRRTDRLSVLLDKKVGICRLAVNDDEKRFLGTVDLGGCVVVPATEQVNP